MTNNSPDEVVFAVMGSVANAAERISPADAGLREREHLQEWVIAHPEIIGPDVMIVTFEFDKWSSTSGEQKDRLDVLGLGKDGRIVVAELKRGRAPDTVDMQALKYAAMASRFKAGLLAEYHAKFSQRDAQHGAKRDPLTEAEALAKLETHSDAVPGVQDGTPADHPDRLPALSRPRGCGLRGNSAYEREGAAYEHA